MKSRKQLNQKQKNTLAGNMSRLKSAQKSIDEFRAVLSINHKTDFDNQLLKEKDKTKFINSCYKQIDAVLQSSQASNQSLTIQSYNGCYLFSDEIDLSKKEFTEKQLVQIQMGKILADNRRHIDIRAMEFQKSSSKENTYQFGINEQLLILSYFGILKQLKSKNAASKISPLIASILNRNEQEVRTAIGQFQIWNSPKTNIEKHHILQILRNLLDTFADFHYDSIVTAIKRDIRALELNYKKQL